MVGTERIMSSGNKLSDDLFFNNAWKKEDRDAQLIKKQYCFIIFLFIICLLLLIGWMREPADLTIHIPPDISNGATLKVGEIPKPVIYSFAYEVWQEINYWPNDGMIDY